MASRSRRGQNNHTDYGELLEVARLYFQTGATQNDIAERLSIPQARVSRLLKQAETEDIVQHIIFPPPMRRLESLLLRELRGKGLRDARVVPRGIGASAAKNEENLGIVTAEYLVHAILDHPGDTVSLCMSCGNTLLAVVMEFTDFLRRNHEILDELKHKTLILYPLSLYWEPTLRFHIDSEYPSTSIYPSALVVFLAMQLMTLGCRVIAHAPQPPLDFYREFDDLDHQEQDRQVTKYSSYLEQAKCANIFLLGVGAGQLDARYGTVLDELGIDLSEELTDNQVMAGEIGYQPFDPQGRFTHFPKLIAVTGEELADISQTETKIIATLGGKQKIPALRALLQRDQLPFNVLVTDEAIAGIFDTAPARRW